MSCNFKRSVHDYLHSCRNEGKAIHILALHTGMVSFIFFLYFDFAVGEGDGPWSQSVYDECKITGPPAGYQHLASNAENCLMGGRGSQ
jgi:hypothetical protein